MVIENPATALFPSMPRSISPSLVDATADLESIGRGPAAACLAAGGAPPKGRDGRDFACVARPDPGAERHRLQHLQGWRRSSAGCAAGWVRRQVALPCRIRRAGRARPGGVREAHQQPADQGDRILPRPEGVRPPARRHPARRSSTRRSRTAVSFASGRPAARPARRRTRWRSRWRRPWAPSVPPSTCASSRPTSTARRSPSPGAALYPPPALQEGASRHSRSLFRENRRRLRGRQVRSGPDDLRRARPRGAGALPPDRPDPVPQRPDLFHRADATRRARDLRVLAARWRSAGPGAVRDGGSDARSLRRGSRPAAGLPRASRADHRCRWLGPSRPGRPRSDARQLDAAIRSTRRDVQAAADSSEAAEKLLLDLGLGVVVVDARYYITRINTAARRMLGIHGLAFDQDFIHLAESLPSTAMRAAIDAALGGKTTTAVYEVDADDMSPRRRPGSSRRSSARMAASRDRRGRGHRAHRRQPALNASAKRAPRTRSAGWTGRRSSTGGLLRANEELTALVARAQE